MATATRTRASAEDAAAALAERLGPGWIPRVWENLGWHFAVTSTCGRWKVHKSGYGTNVFYTAFLGEPDSPGGWWAEAGDTPELAIENTRRVAREQVEAIFRYPDGAL